MQIINKVTLLKPEPNIQLTEILIQAHLDEQNTDGWSLVAVDNLIGGYKFFWKKEVE